MGLIDGIKNLKCREWVNIVFFLISLAMLIAGSVMLAIAIASIPPMPPFDDIPTTTGLPPPNEVSTVQPSQNPLNSSATPVITTTTTHPIHQGAYCDVSSNSLINIFVVDVSYPIIGTLDDKLAKISQFLLSATSLINLDQSANWNNQELRLVVYGGNEPYPLGRAKNQQQWQNIVQSLNSSFVNPTFLDGHQMTDALRFIVNNYRPVYGMATNVVVIGDGFDFDEMSSASTIANVLKNQYLYSLGFLLLSNSQVQQSVVQPLATDFAHFYPVGTVDYLSNPTVLQTQALWACQAYFPTLAPPTPQPTRLPLVTTLPPITQSPVITTPNPSLPAIASCQQNVLFLIDQSQTMILNGYQNAIQFAIDTATSLSSLNSQTTFAYIIYNQRVISESNTYSDLSTFVGQIRNAPQLLGTSDVSVGFSEALNFISTKSRYDDDSVSSLLYFVTDGNFYGSTSNTVVNTTKTIRSVYQTEMIGIDAIETQTTMQNVKNVIGYNLNDGYSKSVYVGVSDPSKLADASLVNSTIYQLQCKGSSSCLTGVTFVIETSEAEGSQLVDVQKQAVINIMQYYNNTISPFGMSVSLVYFSSPDNLVPNQDGQSGILFGQQTVSNTAITTLNQTSFLPLGAASDLQLGFAKTLENLRNGFAENSNLVIFFARGAYEQLANCCPDPSATAAAVRQIATVQGVVIGPYSSKSQLDSLTGSNSIDANALINNMPLNTTEARYNASKLISDSILPIIDGFMKNQYCSNVPSYVSPPCEDPIDVIILLHANDKNNWNKMLNFTASQLIPDLLGSTGGDSSRKLSVSTPINFAIASYYYLDVVTHADFTYLLSLQDYQNLISSISFRETKGTATLSTAYKKSIELFQDGRPYASKNLILITDTLDISDAEDAFSEHDAMVQLVGGYTSALAVGTAVIPGVDYQINIASEQLRIQNNYFWRQMANSLTQRTCIYLPRQVQTDPPLPPTPSLPGPIPVVKGRNVWPDFTILIDTSSSPQNPMTDVLFEKVRTFLYILLNQFSVGSKGSLFTIATFDGESVDYSCKFSDINNYYDMDSCRNERLSYYSKSRANYRNIDRVLSDVRQNIFENSTAGYRSLNENFLILFTLGSSSSSQSSSELTKIQRKGVRTVVVGLSNNMTNNDLSTFAETAYSVPDWNSTYFGIDTNYDLADRIFQLTTKKRNPSTSNFYANFVFVVDQSSNTYSDFSNVAQFVSGFVNPFLVDSVKTQVSVVPFADSVISPLSLSSSQSDVDQWLNNWKSSSASSSSVANVGSAIKYVSNMLASVDRPTYIVFVVGPTNVTGSEILNLQPTMSSLYVANYNSAANVSFNSLVATTDNIYSVPSSDLLLNRIVSMDVSNPNPIVALFDSILAAQQISDQTNFPTSSIAADIVLLLDETGLSTDEFSTMKQFLSNFTQQFSIGAQETQFALQSYNGRTIPHDGFHLFESTSSAVVQQKINQLTLSKATENSTDADLAGAIEQELFFFLTETNGWREDTTTYTIILSHADSFFTRDTATADGVKNVSSVFALGLNGRKFEYVQNFTNTGFYETVDNIESLSINSAAVQNLLTTLNNDYKGSVYPKTIPVSGAVKADFIFLIDSALGASGTAKVQAFLNNFVSTVGNFSSSGNDTRMAVVSYGKYVTTAWDLTSLQDVNSIKRYISQYQVASSAGPSNLRRAIDTVILNEATFGVDANRPNYIIVIASSPTITPNIESATSRHLNTRYSTFVIQTNSNNATYAYSPQVLGTQLCSDRVVQNSDLTFNNDQMNNKFLPWIGTEYTAWQSTFPDKI